MAAPIDAEDRFTVGDPPSVFAGSPEADEHSEDHRATDQEADARVVTDLQPRRREAGRTSGA
jgi:hypothetical protein